MSSASKQEGFVYAGILLSGFGVLTGVLNYSFQLLMGRMLSADDFLAFNAIIALALVIGSPLGALQTVATRYVAIVASTSGRGTVLQLFRQWAPRFWAAVAAAAIVVAAFCGPLQRWLQLPDTRSTWLLTVIVLANLLLIANNTFLQGMQHFFWLGFIPAANVLLRMACCGLLAGILGYGLSGALIAFAAATMICVFLGASILISLTPQTSRQKPAMPTFPYALIPPVTAAMFGLTSMTQIDLVLVNRYFNPETASQYALAAVLGKAVLYLPTGLVSVILPVVAAGHARQQSGSQQAWQAILATLGLAGGAAVGCSFLGPWFVAQLYGEKYGDAGRLLAFYGPAMVPMGVALVTQVFVVAKGRPLFSWIIAATAICEIGMLNAWHPSLEAVLATIAVFNTGLAILGTILVKLAPNDRTVSTPDEI